MTNKDAIFLLVEGANLLAACAEWRERYEKCVGAAYDFANSKGAKGFFRDFDDNLMALTPVDPPPPGWALMKRQRKNDHSRIAPMKGPKGSGARDEIAALPKFPTWKEIRDLINHPCQIIYRGEGGSGFSTCGVSFWQLVQLLWAGDHFVIHAIDTGPQIAALREKMPGVFIEAGEWPVPDGLRRISAARWNFLQAEAAVLIEERERSAVATP